MSLAMQVQKLENELYELKSNKNIESKLLGKHLYSYSAYDESGFILAKSKIQAIEIADIEDVKIKKILSHDDLMKLIKNDVFVKEMLCS